MSRKPSLPPPPPPPLPPPLPVHQSLGFATIRPKPSLRDPARKPNNMQKVRFTGLDKSGEKSLNLLGNIKMKKSYAHSSKHESDVALPPPTLSSGEGEEIPLDGKSSGAALGAVGRNLETPSLVESTGVGCIGGSAVSSKPEGGPATSTPWKLQPKNLKDKLDNFLSPPPRFMRPDGRLFSPRGFVGLSNENEVPNSSPPPGRFFVAFAIFLALLGVALLIAVVAYNTTHMDRLIQELEENKHTVLPADVHDPIIEPLPPSAVQRYVDWPLSQHKKESSEENSGHDDKSAEAHVPKKQPLGKVAIPDLKFFLEPKYPSNESNPVNAILTGSFGSVNGTLDLTKIGDIIHAHMRKKRQVTSFVDRMVLNNLKVMRDELREQNKEIVLAMKAFNFEVKDVSKRNNLDLSGIPLNEVVDFGRTLLKKRETPIKRRQMKQFLDRIIAKKEKGRLPQDGALEALVEKRQQNVDLVSEITRVVDVMENGPGKRPKEDPKSNGITAEEMPVLSAESPSAPRETPSLLDGTPSTPAGATSVLDVTSLTSSGTLPAPFPSGEPPVEELTPTTLTELLSTPAGTSTPTGTPANPAGTPATPAGATSALDFTSSTSSGTLPKPVMTAPSASEAPPVEELTPSTPPLTPVTTIANSPTSALSTVKPEKRSSDSKKSKLATTLEKDITLVHMGRVKGGNTTPSSWKPLSSPDQSGKKAELETVELQENLQSMENATSGSARRGILCDHKHRACSSGDACIHKQFWCDGKVNCPDSSDELNCSCRDRVSRDRLCDGYFDCPNGEDELGCLGCDHDEFDCGEFDNRGAGICAPMATRCDGRTRCPSGKDEQSCSFLSEGILVGVPGQLAAVSMSQGVLHHNWRGEWLPVCWTEADIEWATAVCQEVVSRNVTRDDVELRRVRIPPNRYFGKWISLSNGVSQQENCEFASFVICPKIQPGTRVPPTTDPNESHWNTPSTSGTHFLELLESLKKKVQQFENLIELEAATEGLRVNDVAGATVEELRDVENLLGSFSPTNNRDGDLVRLQRMVSERIVGGTPSRPGAWPWVVAIYRNGKFFCGGAVLNEYWILTAAHCVQDAGPYFMEVQAGMLRRSDFSPTEQIVVVDKVVINSKFNMETIHNDIALVHVSPALKLNRWVRPILLPSTKAELKNPHKLHISDPRRGHKCTVVGWGSTSEYGPSADNELEVKVPVENCTSKGDRSGNDICAGVPEGGRDACQGDSGGPLLCSVPEQPSLWFVAGIVSHGNGCGRPNTPGAYTRVSDYVEWIYQVMEDDSNEKFTEILYPPQNCLGFHCESGTKRCIPKAKRCDKSVDCLNADDEEECQWDMARSFDSTKNGSNSLPGYTAFVPTRNEQVVLKAFHEDTLESTDTGTKGDDGAADAVVDDVHNIVASISGTTTAAITTPTPKPYSSTTKEPPVIFPEPDEPVRKPPSSLSPVDAVNSVAEKGVTPPPLGEALAPPVTEQVNPPPVLPTDVQNLIPTGSDAAKNHTEANSLESESSSESSSVSSESGESGEKSSEEFGEKSDSAKPEKPTEQPEHPPKNPKPLQEPHPPIPVIPVPSDPVPEPTVSPPLIAAFDPNKDFLCANSRQKIIKERYCDGVADCMDKSDETNCTCGDKLLALNPQVLCDGLKDCFDGTDEEGCSLCPPGQFRCGLSLPPYCISQSAVCDGTENCPAGEDEKHCLALTDGETVVLDRAGLPVHQRREGVIAQKRHGVWRAVCGYSKPDRTARFWAYDACKDMGFNDLESFNVSAVYDTLLTVVYEEFTPLVGPVRSATTTTTAPPNLPASNCSAIYVRCSPTIDGNTEEFLVADEVHAWPWLAELLVDGVPTSTGVLIHPHWVVTAYQPFKNIRFDMGKNMLTALMGGPRSELGILQPNDQVRRADDVRLLTGTDILMVRLRKAFIETTYVRPTGLPDWFTMAHPAWTCVAVGRGLQGAWESVLLQQEDTCEGLGKDCFTPLGPKAVCTTNVTTPPWGGALACRGKKGWYPAAVFYEPHGRCGLAGLKEFDTLLFQHRTIEGLIDLPVVDGVNEPSCSGLRCLEGTCLPVHAGCDGVPQCRDARDEDPTFCATLKEWCSPSGKDGCVCSPDEARCGRHDGCIPLTSWCDGRPDCADGSDESTTCRCADLLRATRPHLLCDGRRHCDDYSDEDPAMCGCAANRFWCSRSGHEQCVSNDTVCDGRKDCPNGEDEAQCFSLRLLDAPSVNYNAFGEVVQRKYGLWYDMCAPPDKESQLNVATAVCTAFGMTLSSCNVATRATNPTIASLLLVDSWSDFVLTNRSIISVRGDRPLVQTSEVTVPPEKCLALRVTCKRGVKFH